MQECFAASCFRQKNFSGRDRMLLSIWKGSGTNDGNDRNLCPGISNRDEKDRGDPAGTKPCKGGGVFFRRLRPVRGKPEPAVPALCHGLSVRADGLEGGHNGHGRRDRVSAAVGYGRLSGHRLGHSGAAGGTAAGQRTGDPPVGAAHERHQRPDRIGNRAVFSGAGRGADPGGGLSGAYRCGRGLRPAVLSFIPPPGCGGGLAGFGHRGAGAGAACAGSGTFSGLCGGGTSGRVALPARRGAGRSGAGSVPGVVHTHDGHSVPCLAVQAHSLRKKMDPLCRTGGDVPSGQKSGGLFGCSSGCGSGHRRRRGGIPAVPAGRAQGGDRRGAGASGADGGGTGTDPEAAAAGAGAAGG